MLYIHTRFPFQLLGDMHLPASWSQCNNIPGFSAIVPQYYFKYHCTELMSRGRKKSPEVQDANLFYKLELTFVRSLHWVQHWQGCWGKAALFQGGKPSASSVLYELAWESQGYTYEALSLSVFYFFSLWMLRVVTSVFSPGLVKTRTLQILWHSLLGWDLPHLILAM